MPAVTIAIVSDDHLFSEGLRYILGTVDWLGVVDEVDRAQVRLVDARLDGALGICAALKNSSEGSVILVAGPVDDDRWAIAAVDAGARGILAKTARAEELLQAIRVVHEGLIWAPRRILVRIIDDFAALAQRSREGSLESRLSDREHEVFVHAATGLGNKQVANRLAISEATVKVHLTHIFQKLGVRRRAELAAAYHGLIRLKN